MGIYNADRLSYKLVKKHLLGVTVGLYETVPVSWNEILSLEPLDWWSSVTIHNHRVVYAHFVYRVLRVHAIPTGKGTNPAQRKKALLKLIKDRNYE